MAGTAYVRPKGLSEALKILAEEPQARILAGGTDLVLLVHDRLARPTWLVDISDLAELQEVRPVDGGLAIGAACRLSALERNSLVPGVLRSACAQIGTPQVRNLATIGGNVCNASPAGDTITPLLVLDAEAVVRSAGGGRAVPLTQFFTGPKKTVLRPGELVVGFNLPAGALRGGASFHKIGRRREVVIAQVNAAASLSLGGAGEMDRVRLALGSVAPTPRRLMAVEELMRGRRPTAALLALAGAAVRDEIRPIDDVRTTAAYRLRVSAVLSRRALAGALEEMGVTIQ